LVFLNHVSTPNLKSKANTGLELFITNPYKKEYKQVVDYNPGVSAFRAHSDTGMTQTPNQQEIMDSWGVLVRLAGL